MKPIIGVILRPEKIGNYEKMSIYNEIGYAIIKNGGIPISLYPPTLENYYGKTIDNTKELTSLELETWQKMIDSCAGIICQGGKDYYDYDLKAIKYAHQLNKPLLGICLGMQAMAVAFSGKMEKIETSDHCQPRVKEVHGITIKKSSKLFTILKTEKLKVNSRHEWKVVKTDLEIVAWAEDGVIEAIEDKSKKFFIGLEWHPESMIEDERMNNIFKQFILACK